MCNSFQRTSVLYVSEVLSSASRVDIAVAISAKFADHFLVESVQFMPGGLVHVSFQSSSGKRYVDSVDFVVLCGFHCPVVKPGPRFENVLVFHYPFEASTVPLRRVLSSYGEVHAINVQHYPDLNSVSTGTRVVKMVRKSAIPRSLDIDGVYVKTWFRGQPVECDICGKRGHVSRVCPLRGKCRRCLEPGHLSRDCKKPARTWKVPPAPSSVPSSGPAPAEAACAARPASSIMNIGVYGADDNWGLGSECGSAVEGDGEDESAVEGEVAPAASAAVGMEVSVESDVVEGAAVSAVVVEVVDEGDVAVEFAGDVGDVSGVVENDGEGSVVAGEVAPAASAVVESVAESVAVEVVGGVGVVEVGGGVEGDFEDVAGLAWADVVEAAADVVVAGSDVNVVECVVEESDMVVSGADSVLVSVAERDGLDRWNRNRSLQPGRVLNPDGGFLDFGSVTDHVLRCGFLFESLRLSFYAMNQRLHPAVAPAPRPGPFLGSVAPLRFPGDLEHVAGRKGR